MDRRRGPMTKHVVRIWAMVLAFGAFWNVT